MDKKIIIIDLYVLLMTVLKVSKKVIFAVGILGCMIGISCLDSENILKYIILELVLSAALIFVSFVLHCIEYKYFIEEDYLKWLKENDLDDTYENFEDYKNLVA